MHLKYVEMSAIVAAQVVCKQFGCASAKALVRFNLASRRGCGIVPKAFDRSLDSYQFLPISA